MLSADVMGYYRLFIDEIVRAAAETDHLVKCGLGQAACGLPVAIEKIAHSLHLSSLVFRRGFTGANGR